MKLKRTYKNHEIHWTVFGQGMPLLIAIHGFGDTGASFERLRSLEQHFTVYALDIPFHGQTHWNAPTYTAQDLCEIILDVVKHSGRKYFSMMGHSYGARIILTLLPELHQQIEELYLLAPDGIQGKSGRAARLSPIWLRRKLVRLVEPPDRFFAFLRLIGARYWMPKNSYDFVHLHLSRPHRRKRTFGTWLSMAHFRLEPRQARQVLRTYPIPTQVFLGEDDKIIPPKAGLFLKSGTPNVALYFLAAGHELIGELLDETLENVLAKNRNKDHKASHRL